MFKFFQIHHKLFYLTTSKSFTKKILRTEVKPIQRKVIQEAPIKLDSEKIQKLEKKFLTRLNMLLYAIPISLGLIFTYKILWQDYLTYKKSKNLKSMLLALIGMGTLSLGALAGNYIHDLKRNLLFKSKNIALRRRQHIYVALLFLLFSVNYEFIERNLFYFISTLLSGLGLMGILYIIAEEKKSMNLSLRFNVFHLSLIFVLLLYISCSFTYYKEADREREFVQEFKNRQKFVSSALADPK